MKLVAASQNSLQDNRVVSWIARFTALSIAQILFPNKAWLPALAVAAIYLFYRFIQNPAPFRLKDFSVRTFFKVYWFYFLPMIPFLIAFALSGRQSFYVRVDVINILFTLGMSFVIYATVRSRMDFITFEKAWWQAISFLATLAAGLGVLKFIANFMDLPILNSLKKVGGTYGSALKNDYNNFSLFLLFALLQEWFGVRGKVEPSCFYKKHLPKIALMIIAITLTGSRRGLIVLAVLACFWLLIFFKDLFKSSTEPLRKGLQWALPSLSFSLTIIAMIWTLHLMTLPPALHWAKKSLSSPVFDYQKYEVHLVNTIGRYWTLDVRADQCDNCTAEESHHQSTAYSGRLERWIIGGNLFAEKPFLEKITGSGFNYLKGYADILQPRIPDPIPHGEDYPHNFLLSALLYSGVIGLLLLVPVLWRLILGILAPPSTSGAFGMMTALGLFFISSSGNSFFSSRAVSIIFFLLLLRNREVQPPHAQAP